MSIPAEAPGEPLATDAVATWIGRLARLADAADDAERIDQLRLLEELKAAAAAAQARVTVAFAQSQRQAQESAGVARSDRGRGVGTQVALARRESPYRGGRLVGLAEALVNEMPLTLAALERGETSEWRATIVARETACLTRDQRSAVDAELAGRLSSMGDREVEAQARRAAYRLDPQAFLDRSSRAVADRTVTSRPAPDTMCRLSALLPVSGGVAAHAALRRHADSLRAEGDQRTLGQIMADTLVERLTGAAAAATPAQVTLDLLITDDALLAQGDEPAHLVGYGPIPAPLARAIARDADAEIYVRRLFTRPAENQLLAMEARSRFFPPRLRELLILRDQVCRTPFCGAPIRHADHVVPAVADGPTSEANGQGLCAACNLAKQAPGWSAGPSSSGAGSCVTITTPTGHSYRSEPPPLPGAPPAGSHLAPGTAPGPVGDPTADRPPSESPVERALRELLGRAA